MGAWLHALPSNIWKPFRTTAPIVRSKTNLFSSTSRPKAHFPQKKYFFDIKKRKFNKHTENHYPKHWAGYIKVLDMWSIGCILADLLGRKLIFLGQNFQDQIDKICLVIFFLNIIFFVLISWISYVYIYMYICIPNLQDQIDKIYFFCSFLLSLFWFWCLYM